MIEIQRLHPSEFDLLEKLGDGFKPDPGRSVVVVARNETGLHARSCILAPAHIEGTFIEPAWRKGTILQQLIQAVELEAKSEGITQLLAYADNEKVAEYLERLGYKKMNLTVWEKRFEPCL